MEKFHIDQYLMKGKAAIFLTPGMNVDLTSLHGSVASNGYEDLLAQYGLGVKGNAILEPRHFQMVRFGREASMWQRHIHRPTCPVGVNCGR